MNGASKAFNLFLAVIFVGTLAPSAHGYIDAGSGSYLLQMLLAGLLGAAFTFRTALGALRMKLSRRPIRTQED